MRFSERSNFGEGLSTYSEAMHQARTRADYIDLTASNPTRCGFLLPADLLAPLADPRTLVYEADARGMASARASISEMYRSVHGADVPADRLLLTASTSEAYGYLLRLFCEPGDAILVPSPSYPLFDLLARLHDVELIPYPLVYHDGWQIDLHGLMNAVTPRVRAIVAIHPNNPTGHFCGAADRAALFTVARDIGLPLIVDEVFLEYPLEGRAEESFAKEDPPVLTFVLGGLSKLLALPQMKLAWMAICGPDDLVREAGARLEVIADTFLSVNSPAQVAVPAWLQAQVQVRRPVLERLRQNLLVLDDLLANGPVSRLRVEGGWSAVLRVPALEWDFELAVRLLHDAGLHVHPGSFYGFGDRGWLVVSLLPEPLVFEQGVRRLLAALTVVPAT